MKQEIDLLKFYPQSKRPVEERGKLIKEGDRAIARKFDKEYFDGDRLTGYGGYNYHPRFWTDTVKHIVEFYGLTSESKILDVGCAKGFMMHDLSLALPGAEIKGIDISKYARDHAKAEIKDNIHVASANNLPFEENYFDLVIAINTLHNLPIIDCKESFKEISRVTKANAFVVNDAWRDFAGKQSMLKWNLTALTYMSCNEWKDFFEEVGYEGDYYWFFAE